jgi:deoxyribose-phosphate aldolase
MAEEQHHHEHDAHDHEHVSEYESKYQQMFKKYDLHLHDELVQEDVKQLLADHKAENNTREVKRFLFSCIELTSLRVTDSEDSVLKLVEKVNRFTDANPDFPHLASICVYPRFASVVSNSLEADGVEITAVTGGFPSSQTFAEVKTVETALALKDGATEIDCVMPVGYFLAEDYETVSDEIAELKETCGEETTLKVILETGALQTAANVKKAALMAMYSGADFIKTSTGKIEPGATPAAALVMCRAIKEYYQKTGTKIGIKVAGGIRTTEQALDYYTIVKETLGADWLMPQWFRIGASSLANNLLSDIMGKAVKAF